MPDLVVESDAAVIANRTAGSISFPEESEANSAPLKMSPAPVVSNASTPNKVLTIKGDVEPKPKTLEDIYRYSMGKIRLKTNHMSFARVFKMLTWDSLPEK